MQVGYNGQPISANILVLKITYQQVIDNTEVIPASFANGVTLVSLLLTSNIFHTLF